MRPVLLEMDGFAAFREPTTVDFAGAEYFALVGPTGSGKSTVIDALTFALYGSVPRWDDRRTVGLALAPTVNRGTVRLVFDLGGARYVVARELRRAATGAVSVRNARLERLREPSGLGGPDEDTDALADGAGAVTKAVEELLGLPFGDFCTCVVLPQGDFAEFLHTEPRKRQEKLVRILGLGVYDVIAREANSEAAAQRQRADVLSEQLGAYADATAQEQQAAAARVAELESLAARVRVAATELAAAAAQVSGAVAEVDALAAQRAALAALVAPTGAAELDARRRAAVAAAEVAAQRRDAAEAGDTAARDALAQAPARGPLEQARRDHAELAARTAELPGTRDRHGKARAAYSTAAADAADALAALDGARAARDTAVAACTEAQEAVRRGTRERDGFAALRAPAGLDALHRRRVAARAALASAEETLATAEAADAAARERLAAAPTRGPLERALRDHRDLAAALVEQADAVRAGRHAADELAEAVRRVAHTRAHLDEARTGRDSGVRSNLAAALRPALVEGQDCPVCAQSVTAQVVAALPPPPADADLAEAERAVREAERAHERARRDESAATASRDRADAETARLTATIERLRAALAGAPPTTAGVEAALAECDERAGAVEQAATAVRAARRARAEAAAESDAVRAETDAAAASLRATRDPLVAFGAPAVDDPAEGWAELLEWAAREAATREAALPAARDAADAARREADAAERDLALAERAAAERRREETAAARAEQEAAGAVAALERRIDELHAALDGAPSDAEAAAALHRLDELAAAAREADAELRAARTAQRRAERDAADVAGEVAAAWDALRAARDPLVGHGAPAVTGDDLAAAWEALTAWAGREAAARTERLAAATATARTAEQELAVLQRRLTDDLAAHGVVAGRLPSAPSDVAVALERARAAQERITERRAAAAAITAERDEAESAHQVARLLGGLLRSDGFPRWLVASALDALVADASRSLAELSGGQFELTHDNGEFLVIDHADADARRPVKTLSGGETFQASLALALALSAQMSGLAAQGAARLESIFLDEGFGTLDEANLETVASTLENLATRGDRMVGVITHVPALAERVPVRFAVRRDQRTSSVQRETL